MDNDSSRVRGKKSGISPEIISVQGDIIVNIGNVYRDYVIAEDDVITTENIKYNLHSCVPSFTGRERLLSRLRHYCTENNNRRFPNLVTRVRMSGFGGVGKTELVRQYLQIYAGSYEHVLWINAESYSRAFDCFINIALETNEIELVTADGKFKNDSTIIQEVYDYICRKRAVIVFDNADVFRGVAEDAILLPRRIKFIKFNWNNPVILLTTRRKKLNSYHSIEIPGFEEYESYQFLRRELNFEDNEKNRCDASILWNFCEGMPLMLQHAVTVIKRETKLQNEPYGIRGFLKDYNCNHSKNVDVYLDSENFPYPNSVPNIFKITFDHLAKMPNGVDALKCLDTFALLDPDCIPILLFTNLINTNIPSVAVDLLLEYEFIQQSDTWYTINRAVHSVKLDAYADPNGTYSGLSTLITETAACFSAFVKQDIPKRQVTQVLKNGVHFVQYLDVHNFSRTAEYFFITLEAALRDNYRFLDAKMLNVKLQHLQSFNNDRGAVENTQRRLAINLTLAGAFDDANKLFNDVLQPDISALVTTSEQPDDALKIDPTSSSTTDEPMEVPKEGTHIGNKDIHHSIINNISGTNCTVTQNVPPAPTATTQTYTIVHDCIDSFTGRENIISQLHSQIQQNQVQGELTVVSQTKVISGIGGVGKTETIRKYLQQFVKCYELKIWINADSYVQIKDTFLKIASRFPAINIRDYKGDLKEDAEIAHEVYDQICQKTCVIVFDNAHSLENEDGEVGIKNFLPAKIQDYGKAPAIIVTSRKADWGHINTIQLGGLTLEESIKLFSCQLDIAERDKSLVAKIRHICDGLPLLLQQIIAVVKNENKRKKSLGKQSYRLQEYFDQYMEKGNYADVYPAKCSQIDTVYKIFSITFEKLGGKEHGNLISKCLDVMALLNPDCIPAELIEFLVLEEEFLEGQLADCLITLQNYNLVKLANDSYEVHRMVQVTRLEILKRQAGDRFHEVITETANRFNEYLDVLGENNKIPQIVLLNAMYLAKIVNQEKLSSPAAVFLHKLGNKLE